MRKIPAEDNENYDYIVDLKANPLTLTQKVFKRLKNLEFEGILMLM